MTSITAVAHTMAGTRMLGEGGGGGCGVGELGLPSWSWGSVIVRLESSSMSQVQLEEMLQALFT